MIGRCADQEDGVGLVELGHEVDGVSFHPAAKHQHRTLDPRTAIGRVPWDR